MPTMKTGLASRSPVAREPVNQADIKASGQRIKELVNRVGLIMHGGALSGVGLVKYSAMAAAGSFSCAAWPRQCELQHPGRL